MTNNLPWRKAAAAVCYTWLKWLEWAVDKEGEYVVSVKFDEKHIPDSPWRVHVSPSSGEARKLEICSFPDMNVAVGKPVTFTIITHGAKGKIDAKVTHPSGSSDDCFITPIDDDETYAVRFIPKEQGNYFISITLDGSHMHDSPFRVRVGGRDEADPLAVIADGAGLKGGETGQKLEYIINTCNSGTGTLDVECNGPSKVTLDCYELDVGYKVRYTPFAPGDYYFMIKYNGVHIPGSPFRATVAGKAMGGSGESESAHVRVNTVSKSGEGQVHAPAFHGDASKVECKGLGMKKSFAGRMSQFNVDATKAGEDMLLIAVMGPKGFPCEELHVKHMGRGNYQVNYKITEKGMWFIHVKYGENHVPGSPFQLVV